MEEVREIMIAAQTVEEAVDVVGITMTLIATIKDHHPVAVVEEITMTQETTINAVVIEIEITMIREIEREIIAIMIVEEATHVVIPEVIHVATQEEILGVIQEEIHEI